MSATTQVPAPQVDAPIIPGLPVLTLDNKRLGTVRELTDSHFKVKARWRRDYWLARNQVAYVDEHCVGMLFRADEAELYRLTSPADESMRQFERRPRTGFDDITDPNLRGRFPL